MTAPPARPDTAGDQLSKLLDGIQERVHTSQRIARIDERSRLTLLFGHAIFAMLVVPGFALLSQTGMSSPSFVVLRNIPGAPYTLATWIGLAGVALAVAALYQHRLGEFWSLGALLLWYAMFSVSLIAAIAVWAAPAIEAGGVAHFTAHLDWRHGPALYAPVVYAHLAYAMGGHMRTLWKLGLTTDRAGGP